ncbi:MAG: hypothetical protein ACTH9H_09920 [Galactobacter sp.]
MLNEVDQIIKACGEEPVCLFDGASISNAPALRKELPDGVQVVVIPQPDQAQSVDSSQIASSLHREGHAETVIVIEDRSQDRFAVSSSHDAARISEDLYAQGEPDGGVAVAAVASSLASSEGSADSGGGFPVGGVLSAAVAVVVVAGGAAGLFGWLKSRKRKRSESAAIANRRLHKDLADALDGPDGEYVEEAVESLGERARALPDLGPLLLGLQGHVSELFVRVRKRGTDQQVRLLISKYKDTLTKLLKALEDDYYADIQDNPHYWSNAEARLDEVRKAVDSVDKQAVENIRQVNESRDLEFKVALDSLIRAVDEAKLSDVYTDRDH